MTVHPSRQSNQTNPMQYFPYKSHPYFTKAAEHAIAAARKQLDAGQTVTPTIRTHTRLGLKVLLGREPIVRSQNAYGASVGAALELLIPGLNCRCAENNSAVIDRVVVLAGYRLTKDPDGFHVRKEAEPEAEYRMWHFLLLDTLRQAHEWEVRTLAELLANPCDKTQRAWSAASKHARTVLAAVVEEEAPAAALKAA